jgi:hypothetical protein
MSIEMRENPFNRKTIDIMKNGMKRGTITPDGDLCDIFGNKIGRYMGGNQAKDNFGFLKTIADFFKY